MDLSNREGAESLVQTDGAEKSENGAAGDKKLNVNNVEDKNSGTESTHSQESQPTDDQACPTTLRLRNEQPTSGDLLKQCVESLYCHPPKTIYYVCKTFFKEGRPLDYIGPILSKLGKESFPDLPEKKLLEICRILNNLVRFVKCQYDSQEASNDKEKCHDLLAPHEAALKDALYSMIKYDSSSKDVLILFLHGSTLYFLLLKELALVDFRVENPSESRWIKALKVTTRMCITHALRLFSGFWYVLLEDVSRIFICNEMIAPGAGVSDENHETQRQKYRLKAGFYRGSIKNDDSESKWSVIKTSIGDDIDEKGEEIVREAQKARKDHINDLFQQFDQLLDNPTNTCLEWMKISLEPFKLADGPSLQGITSRHYRASTGIPILGDIDGDSLNDLDLFGRQKEDGAQTRVATIQLTPMVGLSNELIYNMLLNQPDKDSYAYAMSVISTDSSMTNIVPLFELVCLKPEAVQGIKTLMNLLPDLMAETTL